MLVCLFADRRAERLRPVSEILLHQGEQRGHRLPTGAAENCTSCGFCSDSFPKNFKYTQPSIAKTIAYISRLKLNARASVCSSKLLSCDLITLFRFSKPLLKSPHPRPLPLLPDTFRLNVVQGSREKRREDLNMQSVTKWSQNTPVMVQGVEVKLISSKDTWHETAGSKTMI